MPRSPDGGVIADYTGPVDDPARLAARLSQTVGVVDHGLFPAAMVSDVVFADGDAVEIRSVGAGWSVAMATKPKPKPKPGIKPRRPGLIAGVDLGGTKIQVVAMRGDSVAGSARSLTPQSGKAGDVIEEIERTLAKALSEAGIAPAQLKAVGVGSPGEIDHASGAVVHAANVPGFGERVELGALLSEHLGGVRVAVDNDVSVGVLGEYRLGAGRAFKDVLGVWLGTGVGGGLILGGELRSGRGSAGEFGHIVAKPGGRRCGCGNRGCVEAYAGRASMERRARALVSRGHKTSLFKIMEERGKTA